jgi:hypothetical protein
MDVHMTPQDAGMARSFWLILSALLINWGFNGYMGVFGGEVRGAARGLARGAEEQEREVRQKR